MAKRNICVVGGGRWGQNHIRTYSQLGYLGGIVEADSKRLSELLELYPEAKGFGTVEEALEGDFDGFTLVTPAITHHPIGKKILEKGKSLLIEKPMTLSSADAADLVEIAKANNAQLMVGHLLLFHPAIIKIKELIDSGKIGELYYLYSNRLNLGTVRTEENVFWSFAPHDVSVLDYLVGSPSIDMEAKGEKFLQKNVYDTTMTQLTYPNNVHAHIFVSWLHPFKEQRLVVIGSKGMITFEDSSQEKNILFYNKRVDFEAGKPILINEPSEVVEYQKGMPLTEELKYFAENMSGKIEIADGQSGYEVIRILEKAQELIDKKNN